MALARQTLVTALMLLLSACAPSTSSSNEQTATIRSAPSLFVRPGEDLGVHHLTLPGNIPSGNGNTSDAVMLHVFMSLDQQPFSTTIRGYFFAEATSKYQFTPWGQCSQPPSVRNWTFPVVFRDLHSREMTMATIPRGWWRAHAKLVEPEPGDTSAYARERQEREPLHYPIKFAAKLTHRTQTPAECLEVSMTKNS